MRETELIKELTFEELTKAWWGWDFQEYLRINRTSCYLCHEKKSIRPFYYHSKSPYNQNLGDTPYLLITWCGECPIKVEHGEVIQELTSKEMFTIKTIHDRW